MNRVLFFISIAFALCSCAVQRSTTSEGFVRDIQKDIPFKVNELKKVSNHDNTYSFRSDGYIGLLPDYEVDSEGASMIFETTFAPTHHTQPSNVIWRNIVINRKAKRVLCIDRLIQNGRTFGYVYVLQSETARYSDSGTFHWDVSNPKLLLNVSDAIEGMSEFSVVTLNTLTKP
ncbi:MAG: hypothetical protein IJ650_03230 [Paludibacteraceae bacterium]|nr:hypothetical protein [Paludibacteraceae bacterium]